MYDQTGSTGDAQGHPGFNGDPFSQFRGGFGGGQGMGGFEDLFKDIFNMDGRQGQQQPQETVVSMRISFNEAVNGT